MSVYQIYRHEEQACWTKLALSQTHLSVVPLISVGDRIYLKASATVSALGFFGIWQ